MSPRKGPAIAQRLIEFQAAARQLIVDSRKSRGLHKVQRDSVADTIYQIDTLIEPLLEDFCREWGKRTPLVLIAEGIHDDEGREGKKVYPAGTAEENAEIRLIIDPIDGTRGLMYDKRAGWALAGVAPNKGAKTRLSDIEVSVMTELPTSKMGWGDVLWAIKGGAARGRRVDLANGDSRPLAIQPSKARSINHGFAMMTNFLPGTKVLAAGIMEELIAALIGPEAIARATVFDDQYISTGGQFYELIVGHDLFNADLRPLLYTMSGMEIGMCCHPYDSSTWLIAQCAGVILTDGTGGRLDGPLDVTTPISWAGYANRALRDKIQPLLNSLLRAKGFKRPKAKAGKVS